MTMGSQQRSALRAVASPTAPVAPWFDRRALLEVLKFSPRNVRNRRPLWAARSKKGCLPF